MPQTSQAGHGVKVWVLRAVWSTSLALTLPSDRKTQVTSGPLCRLPVDPAVSGPVPSEGRSLNVSRASTCCENLYSVGWTA